MEDKQMQLDSCGTTVVHEDIINDVRDKMIDGDDMYGLSEIFKVLSDPTRLRILNALSISEMCVCDISALLGMTQSAISHQLKSLKQTRLVKFRREGKIVYYSLDDDHVKQIIDQGLIHVKER